MKQFGNKEYRLKIAVDARAFGNCPSGVGVYAYDFVKELALKADFKIELLTDVACSSQISSLRKTGIPVHCYGLPVFRSGEVYRYFKFMRHFLTCQQPDLFWEPNNLLPFSLKGYKGKVAVTIHDLFPITEQEYFSWFYRLYFYFGMHGSIKWANMLLFASKETEKQVKKFFSEMWKKEGHLTYPIVRKPPVRARHDGGFFCILEIWSEERELIFY
ncbi:MAG: glycosyltransferase family 4 protein [Lachnospiraceae bacterium]|nr:glycosyltransferase family 4 protein [Lachnospiraceae bacterium]